jgi:hypothetical protein
MVSGTQWPTGDPFLERQNEPTIAVSSRNSLHLLGGANDYRTVDLPGLPNGETGDAWLGVFKSYDGGATWTSTLHPGCPQNVDVCNNGAPMLKGYSAAADPVVRTGANGMFYYSGIVFTRTTPAKSAVFVSRFIDNNNQENGDSIQYVDTAVVGLGTTTVFVDKPWLAVDIPRAGAGTCTIAAPQGAAGSTPGATVQQTFAAGNLYIAYTTLVNDGQPPSQIRFQRSTDCGVTWSAPVALSDANINQGATLAIDPNSGTLYVAWRRFATQALFDAIMVTKSTDGGQTFTTPTIVGTINAFDQGTTAFSFRTNDYPAMTVDATGRIYMAWAERGVGVPTSGGDARIVMSTSHDGVSWSQRFTVDDFPARGHQFMPAMTFGGGKIMVIFYDLREDTTIAGYVPLGQGQYYEQRVPQGDLATSPPHPEKVFTQYVLDAAPAALNEGGLLWRHTVEVWSAQADPGDQPYFNAARVSQFEYGSLPGSSAIQQLQLNPPNFPMFSQGSEPFIGDYLDIAASPSMTQGAQPGTWKFAADPSPSVAFQAVWADNRDVRPPANGDWTDYTPPISASTGGLSVYDPSQPQPSCVTGQTGMRNENIYTSQITQGLVVGSPSNAKRLGTIQRAFPVVVTNTVNLTQSYRLTIVNQPAGGKASFLQTPTAGFPDPLTMLDISVAPLSTASRMVFVTSSDPTAMVQVTINQIPAPGAVNLTAGGLSGTVLLNPDPLNPDDPDISTTEIFNPSIANPSIANPSIANPSIANPSIANPSIANPSIANPSIANLNLANPSIANADIANPSIANPSIANPSIANPSIANTSITDSNWAVSNNGNSTGTYSVHFLTDTNIPSRVLPQLIVNKTYNTPVANGCTLTTQPQTIVVANVANPPLVQQQNLSQTSLGRQLSAILRRRMARVKGVRPLDDSSTDGSTTGDITDSSLDDVTVTVGPGETVYVTLRFFNTDATQPLGFDPGADVTTITISQATNTGGTAPPIAASHLIAATGTLPAGVVGVAYDSFLLAAGGQTPYTWALPAGQSLPPGLSLASSGEVTGTPTGTGGSYSFTVTVTDSSSPAQTATETVTMSISSVALAITGLAAQTSNGQGTAKPGDTITVTVTVSNSGSLADAVTPVLTVNATGTATTSCGTPQPGSASIAGGAAQTYTYQCGSVAGSGTLSFSVAVTATDDASGANISVTPALPYATPVITVLGAPPTVTVSAAAGGSPYIAGTWTNQNVVVTFVCTPSTGTPDTQLVTVASEGANQTVTTSCTDAAGNSTPASFGGIYIDKTPPAITVSATVDGQPYTGQPTDQAVLVSFNCTDALSGVAQAPQSQLISSGTGQSVTSSCTDKAGNVATATFSPINIVTTPPSLTANYGGYTPGSWTSQAVTVTFTCVPAGGIGYQSISPPVTVSNQGANQFVAGRCTDLAGNTTQSSFGPINIETSPPVLTELPLPPATAGWYRTPVTVSWICSDPLGGAQTVSRTISTQGANQTATVTCTNLAGTSVTASQTVNVDLTPPVISGTIVPQAGITGWYTPPVTVSFQCADALSGVAGSPAGGTTLTADTNGTNVTGTCYDVAGNVASTTVGPVKIDRTPPSIQLQSIVPLNAAGWSNQSPVTVTWACTDTGSGPVSPTVSQQVSGNGTGFSATGTCMDVAGNSASATQTGIKIDTVPPLVTFRSPADGAQYAQNSSVVASYTCADALSGVATCTGTAANGQVLQLSSTGTFSFTVTATDVAGNQTQITHSYTVVGNE